MADIRINALATTATSTASDDYIAIDGSANGTRKLNAYSPTFGGNLTVNSTTDASSAPTGSIYTAGGIAVGTNKKFMATGTGGYWGAAAASTLDTLLIRATGFGYSPTSYAGVQIGGTAGRSITFGVDISAIAGGQFSGASNEWIIPNTLNIRQVTSDGTNFSTAIFTIGNGGATTIGGNLTVIGTGNSSVAGTWLIGTTTDSGNGKLQLATHTTSAGGIGFGTDTSLFRAASGNLNLYGSGTNSQFLFSHSSSTAGKGFEIQLDSSRDVYIWQRENRAMYFGTNATSALTLDSSQNATFAGTIKPQQAATASAPTYVKGAIYFDTTLNKLRVGGATGWETITSV